MWLLDSLANSLLIRRRYWGRFNFARRMEWRSVLTLLDPQPSERVCDIGCGAGAYVCMMSRRVREIHGIDIALEPLRRVTGPETSVFECARAERLPFRDATFDGAYSISTFEHLDDDVTALREIRRVLKGGGRAVLTLDSFSSRWERAGEHRDKTREERDIRRVYRLPEAVEWLESNGFVVEGTRYLVRSRVAHSLYQLGSRLGFGGSFLFVSLYPIIYPLAVVSEWFCRWQRGGTVLVVAVRKPAAPRSC